MAGNLLPLYPDFTGSLRTLDRQSYFIRALADNLPSVSDITLANCILGLCGANTTTYQQAIELNYLISEFFPSLFADANGRVRDLTVTLQAERPKLLSLLSASTEATLVFSAIAVNERDSDYVITRITNGLRIRQPYSPVFYDYFTDTFSKEAPSIFPGTTLGIRLIPSSQTDERVIGGEIAALIERNIDADHPLLFNGVILYSSYQPEEKSSPPRKPKQPSLLETLADRLFSKSR